MTWIDATRIRRRGTIGVGVLALAGLLFGSAGGAGPTDAKPSKKPKPRPATFALERSQAALNANCLTGAAGSVRVFKLGFAERMEVSLAGLPANTEFDLFVIQVPDNPFGLSWYQGDLETDKDGKVTRSFVGRFSEETFIVAPGAAVAPIVHPGIDVATNPATQPVHTSHVGVWFNSPAAAAAAGCGDAVTPFNGDHTAGVQALSTRGFAPDDGPLLRIGS